MNNKVTAFTVSKKSINNAFAAIFNYNFTVSVDLAYRDGLVKKNDCDCGISWSYSLLVSWL